MSGCGVTLKLYLYTLRVYGTICTTAMSCNLTRELDVINLVANQHFCQVAMASTEVRVYGVLEVLPPLDSRGKVYSEKIRNKAS
jgi:hypothetical protein